MLVIVTSVATTKAPAHPPPSNAPRNGVSRRRFTPKMAGSVIPRKADTADGIAMSLIFVARWRIRKYAASAAPPWATLDIDQIGSSGLAHDRRVGQQAELDGVERVVHPGDHQQRVGARP